MEAGTVEMNGVYSSNHHYDDDSFQPMVNGNGKNTEGKEYLDYSVIDVIRAKRDRKELTKNQIKSFVAKLSLASATKGTGKDEEATVHEAQIGAFLMAVFVNGLSSNETKALTEAMTYSGYTFKWPKYWKGTMVDKHSTGGVGDKTSLILAPALAACGLHVPMVSGRGLDITGGTLDKLESIPGFNVLLSVEAIHNVLGDVGCCIVGQTADLVPADKELYRIRDTTATVDNENLIVASIISKKAAESLDALVLDIKVGSGALMKSYKEAKSLGENLVKVGNSFGMKVSGIMTAMESPLGKACGNALEVAEAIETLQNNGPEDLHQLVVALGGKLLELTGHTKTFEHGKERIARSIENGDALAKFKSMIVAQGTKAEVAQEICHGDKWRHLPKASCITNLHAKHSGFVQKVDAFAVGKLCHALGCGRTAPGLPIKYDPGVVLHCKPGDSITKGQLTMSIHHDGNEKCIMLIKSYAEDAITIESTRPQLPTLVLEIIE